MEKVLTLMLRIFLTRWLVMVTAVVVVTADTVEQIAEGKILFSFT